jgi:Ala-tRNA(Pro) deacylase
VVGCALLGARHKEELKETHHYIADELKKAKQELTKGVSDMDCRERLEQVLRENNIPFETMTHAQAYTMPEVAAALHVPGRQVAKVVVVKADGKTVMLVVSASHRLNFAQVRAFLGAKKVSLAEEEEFADLFPDCATGAMPPFGNLYDVPVYVDQALADEEQIVFRVGTHRHTMKVAYDDFARLAQPMIGEFAEHL